MLSFTAKGTPHSGNASGENGGSDAATAKARSRSTSVMKMPGSSAAAMRR